MKIAVTSTGPALDSPMDPRFGRAPYIVIVDSETFACEAMDNTENVNALKGAGIQAAETVCERGAQVLITGHCGPNAFRVLKAADVGVANMARGSVREAVEAYMEGKLSLSQKEDVDAYW